MKKQTTPAQVIRQVAERHGGLSGLAAALTLPGIRPERTVWAWINRNHVPPEHAAAIEFKEAVAVSVEQLTRGVRWRRVPNAAWPHPAGEPVIAVSAEAA